MLLVVAGYKSYSKATNFWGYKIQGLSNFSFKQKKSRGKIKGFEDLLVGRAMPEFSMVVVL